MSPSKQMTAKSFMYCQALAAIQQLTQEELLFIKMELEQKTFEKSILLQSNKLDNSSFFLFGKWPDFEDADTLRKNTWKRNYI